MSTKTVVYKNTNYSHIYILRGGQNDLFITIKNKQLKIKFV